MKCYQQREYDVITRTDIIEFIEALQMEGEDGYQLKASHVVPIEGVLHYVAFMERLV